MADFGSCLVNDKNWIPTLVTFVAVFIAVSILSQFKNKILYVTLLPARVIILGVLWSQTPGKESVQLDTSFNEVSVSVMFILLVKDLIETTYGLPTEDTAGNEKLDTLKERRFFCFDRIHYTVLLLVCSFVALMPAVVSVIAEVSNQYAMGVLSTVVVILLLSRQHKQSRPTHEINIGVKKIIWLSLVISSLTFISSVADCLGLESGVGLICAYPIDSIIILWQVVDEGTKLKNINQQVENFRQIVYLIALSCYVHYTMTLIIWSSTKIEFIKDITQYTGLGTIVPLIIIIAISGGIVYAVIESVGFVKRLERFVTSEVQAVVVPKATNRNFEGNNYEMVSQVPLRW